MMAGILRLKCKLMVVKGKPFLVSHMLLVKQSETVLVFGMRDDATIRVPMLIDEYNALPYHWFEEDGQAPKASAIKPIPM